MHAGIIPLFLLLFCQGIVITPPQDFASLLKPVAVLEQLQVQTDEASLLAILTPGENAVRLTTAQLEQAFNDLGGNASARKRGQQALRTAGEDAIPILEKAAASDDPEVQITAQQILADIRKQRMQAVQNNTGYLKQLMAIRALQESKSTKALPLLQRLAAGGNPTLSDAATNAILVIQGKAVQWPKGRDALAGVMTHLPANVGFVAVCDLERGRQAMTMDDLLQKIQKEAEKNPQLQAMTGQFGAMAAQIQKGMIQGLGMVGNVRLDSITLLVSNNLGVDGNAGYVACIVKGLHDPAMVAGALKLANSRLQEKNYRKQTVMFGNDTAFASLDPNTFVLAFGDANDGSQIHAVLDGLLADPKPGPAKELKPAFDLVMAGKARLAVAGSFSGGQKQLIIDEYNQQLARFRQRQGDNQQAMAVAFVELILAQFKVQTYVGRLTDEPMLVIDGACADAATAAELANKVNKLDQLLRDTIGNFMAKLHAQGDNPFVQVFAKLDLKKPLFEAKATDKNVTASLQALQGNILSMLPAWMMMMFSGAMF